MPGIFYFIENSGFKLKGKRSQKYNRMLKESNSALFKNWYILRTLRSDYNLRRQQRGLQKLAYIMKKTNNDFCACFVPRTCVSSFWHTFVWRPLGKNMYRELQHWRPKRHRQWHKLRIWLIECWKISVPHVQQALQKNSVSSSVEKQQRAITIFDVLMTTWARNIKYLILYI